MDKIFLGNVFFQLRIEDVFSIATKMMVATGRVACGEIHDKSDVIITDATGLILKKTKIKNIEWFGRGRYEHVTADEGMNIAVVFNMADEEYLQIDHYVVIE
jgi:translation elongation factor EF-Tu-like GTPase